MNNPIEKWAKDLKTFLQRRYTNGQQAPEKMLNITYYQRNANQNYNGSVETNLTSIHEDAG